VPGEAALVADGFSCRAQIGKLSGRHARHLAEVLARHIHEDHHAAATAPRINTDEVSQ
jgi:hypothetical protein